MLIFGGNWLMEPFPARSTKSSWKFLLPTTLGLYSWDVLTYLGFRNFDVFGHSHKYFLDFPELFYPSWMTIMCIYNPG